MTPDFHMVETNGIRLRVALQGTGPLVVMVHGFPESWYSWRHQMPPLVEAGFTACAIDVRGYGGSDKPYPVESYAMSEMAADVAGVVQALSPGAPAVLIGHDWGAPIVWHTAVLHPSRVRAVAGLSVPYFGLPPASMDELIRKVYTDEGRFFYQAYFSAEGVAEAALEADVRGSLRKLYYDGCGEATRLKANEAIWSSTGKTAGDALLDGMSDPDPFPAWLTDADIDYYVGEFQSSGFRGPLNRYRNHTRDFAYMSRVEDRVIRQPTLYVAGENDLVLNMFGRNADACLKRMAANAADHRGSHLLAGIGHWTQQEAPDETNRLLLDWLATV